MAIITPKEGLYWPFRFEAQPELPDGRAGATPECTHAINTGMRHSHRVHAVIARSGFQKYRVSEMTDPENLLEDYSPNDELDVWRDPEEVFSPATLASFEGKSVTLGHPDKILDPDNDRNHAIGHVQNVRRGREPLESGNWPMLADVILKDANAIAAVKSGERELSCGYSYRLAREGKRWDQREIQGNHVALVPKGRAGTDVRIAN